MTPLQDIIAAGLTLLDYLPHFSSVTLAAIAVLLCMHERKQRKELEKELSRLRLEWDTYVNEILQKKIYRF